MIGPGEERGFSLIEVLVAMVLLSVGMAGGLGMLEAGRMAAVSGDRQSRAAAAAGEAIEEMLAISNQEAWESAASGSDIQGEFLRTWSVDRNAPRNGMMLIRVTVGWKAGGGGRHEVSVAAARAAGVHP